MENLLVDKRRHEEIKMGLIEFIEKIEDWLDRAGGEEIVMSKWDYADENTREYWNMLYNSDPTAFTQEQINIIESAFIYNASIETLEDGESAQPRIRTVNLMHPQYSPKMLTALSEAMKIGVDLKSCVVRPKRWREPVLDTLIYGFQKNINVIEISNSYVDKELRGIIDGMEQGIDLVKYLPKHKYIDAISGDKAFELIQSGTIDEKQCLKHIDYLNKENLFDTYELNNLTSFIKLGGNPQEFIDEFCKGQHVYHMTYRRKGQLLTNENAVKEKNEKMITYIKEYRLVE